jgi:hypothetical protein
VACCTIWVRLLLPEAITAGSRARRHSGTRGGRPRKFASLGCRGGT